MTDITDEQRAALGDTVPREQYDAATLGLTQTVERLTERVEARKRERDYWLSQSARLSGEVIAAEDERDALAAQRAQMRALVIDALANADDTHMGWDAEVSATALLDILDAASAVSLALHDAEVKAQALDEAREAISTKPAMLALPERFLAARAAAIREAAE